MLRMERITRIETGKLGSLDTDHLRRRELPKGAQPGRRTAQTAQGPNDNGDLTAKAAVVAVGRRCRSGRA